jgi:3-deoxy-D-manno-octulosonic-acid transferase
VDYRVYNILLTVLAVIALPLLPVLYFLGKRYSMGLAERFGFYSQEIRSSAKNRRSLWIHAASVGESLAAARLAEEMKGRFPHQKILVSTFTQTGYETARRALPDVSVIFLPLDHPWIVKRALAALEPGLIVFLETEIWPNLLRLAHRAGIPTVLLSGRLSPRSFKRYSRLSRFFRRVLQNFTIMGMQTEEDAGRAKRLGADPRKVIVTGNLKLAASKSAPGDENERPRFLDSSGACDHRRPMLVAGSSHEGEEEILLDVFRLVRQSFPDLQMILAPRHPQRFAQVEKLLRTSGLNFAKKSELDGRCWPQQEVFLLDTIGDLADFYAIGDIAFVGGSLVDAGGHNLLEPARFRRPVLFGPYMANFAAVAAEMREKGGGVEVRGATDLAREIGELLRDPKKRLAMGEQAYHVAIDSSGVGERASELLSLYLQAS